MPFKSKAQQRFMFATNPEKAKEWAGETKDIKKLPEKKHPQVNPKRKHLPPMEEKTASEGMFFEKRSQPQRGRFFRDLVGRESGEFAKEAFTSYAPGQIPRGGGINVGSGGGGGMGYGTGTGQKTKASEMRSEGPTESVNAGATGAPVGGMGEKGEGMGGGMYGAGEGSEDSDETKAKKSDEERLKALLGKAVAQGNGEERKAGEPDEKTAGKTPSDWDAESGLPTGFHRPAYEQPEALERGGERFHSTEAKGPDYGAGEGMTRHGLKEGGSLRLKGSSGSQLGKHASSPRFLGTSYGIDKTAKSWAGERGEEFKKSLHEAGRATAGAGSDIVKSITKSPVASVIAAALLARFGYKGLKRGAGAAKRLVRGPAPKAPPPKSITDSVVEGAKRIGTKLGLTS